MKSFKKLFALLAAGMMAVSMTSCSTLTDLFNKNKEESSSEEPVEEAIILKNVTQAKNVILMIGDGMGPNQIKAGELYKNQALHMQRFPYSTKVETCSANASVTDSAAAGTALATGTRTNNGVVALDPETQQIELTTIVDIAHEMGKSTGVIATEELYGATPMAFSGHAKSRKSTMELIESAATSSNVDFFACSTISDDYIQKFVNNGYEQIVKVDSISDSAAEKVIGSYAIKATATPMSDFAAGVALDRVVTEALEYLSKDEDGFFLMTEGSHIDHGGHQNNFRYMLQELLAFDDAIQAVLKWAQNRDDTVVIVTADHETGGLQLMETATHQNTQAAYEGVKDGSCYQWTTGDHTNTDVMCFINGADVDFAKYSFAESERIKNIDVNRIIKDLFGVE